MKGQTIILQANISFKVSASGQVYTAESESQCNLGG